MSTATTTSTAKPVVVAQAAPVRYVQLLIPHNPKKAGSASAARYSLYVHGMSTTAYAEAVAKAGQPKRKAAEDLRWDVKHGFVALHGTAKACGEAPKAKA